MRYPRAGLAASAATRWWPVLAIAVLGLSWALPEPARAQPAPNGAARPRASAPAFDIEVRAPEALRALLERHLSLRRYRDVRDLEDAELERLVSLAEQETRHLLATQGYFTPRITLRVEHAARPPRVLIDAQPGEPAVVREVDMAFEGDIATTRAPAAVAQREDIRRAWALPVGQPFTQQQWTQAKDQAVQALLARHYPRGRITYSLADVDAATARARLGLRLDSGPLFVLGPMALSGARRYPPLVAQRFARLPPGSVYDQQELNAAQLRLTDSGYYETAFITVDPQSDPLAAPVQVSVREARLQRWVLGLGVTTDLGPYASVEYRHNRWPHPHWRTQARLQIERTAPFAEIDLLSIPGEDGWRWGGQARLARHRDTDGQDVRALRLRAGRSRVTEHISREAHVQLDQAEVRDDTHTLTREERGEGAALAANYVVTWRYFDNADQPTRGWSAGLEVGGGLTLTGSSQPFQRTLLRWKQFIPFAPSRLQLRAEAGAVLASHKAQIPATQLFRTGGDTTVRGYGYREIGARQAGGVDAPGRYLLVGSVEWMRPIRREGQPSNLEHTLFIDAGAVADQPGDLEPVYGLGTGIRYSSPIGPLQASLAYGLQSRRLRLHLTVGVTF